jgi:hypothetical protein
MVIGEDYTLIRQRAQIGCVDLAAVWSQIGVAQIIGKNEDDIGTGCVC